MKQLGYPSSTWATNNPIIPERVLAIETDTNKLKVGDGETPWNDLPYLAGSGSGDVEEAPADGKQYVRKDSAWVEVADNPQTIETITANRTLTAADNNKILLISGNGVTITLPASAPNFTIDIVKMDEDFVTLAQTSSTDKFREDTTTITVAKDVTIFSTGVVGKEYAAIGAYTV